MSKTEQNGGGEGKDFKFKQPSKDSEPAQSAANREGLDSSDVQIDVSEWDAELEGKPSLDRLLQELDAAEKSALKNRDFFARKLNEFIEHPSKWPRKNLQGSAVVAWETVDEYNAFEHATAKPGQGIELPMTEKEMEHKREEEIERSRKYLAEMQKAVDMTKTIRDHFPDVLPWAKKRAGESDRYDKEISTKDWVAFKESLGLPSTFEFNLEHHMREKLAEIVDAVAGIKDVKRGNYAY